MPKHAAPQIYNFRRDHLVGFWAFSQTGKMATRFVIPAYLPDRLPACFLTCLPLHPSSCCNSAPTGRVFMKFDISVFSENQLIKFKIFLNMTPITDTLNEKPLRL